MRFGVWGILTECNVLDPFSKGGHFLQMNLPLSIVIVLDLQPPHGGWQSCLQNQLPLILFLKAMYRQKKIPLKLAFKEDLMTISLYCFKGAR